MARVISYNNINPLKQVGPHSILGTSPRVWGFCAGLLGCQGTYLGGVPQLPSEFIQVLCTLWRTSERAGGKLGSWRSWGSRVGQDTWVQPVQAETHSLSRGPLVSGHSLIRAQVIGDESSSQAP